MESHFSVDVIQRAPARSFSPTWDFWGIDTWVVVGGYRTYTKSFLIFFFPLSHDLHFTIVSPLLDYIQHIHARTAKIETWSSLPPRFRKKTEEIPRVPDHSLSPLSQSSFSDFFRCCSNSGGSLVGNRKSRTTPPASIWPQVLFSRIRCEDVIESYIHGERNNFENIYLCGLWHPEGGRFPTPR